MGQNENDEHKDEHGSNEHGAGMNYLNHNHVNDDDQNSEQQNTLPAKPFDPNSGERVFNPSQQHESGSMTGYYKAKKEQLAYGGIYYPEEMEIMYRGATLPEIRHWSTMDTDNEFDVMEHFSMLLKSCVRVSNGSWKDILEVDRFKLVLMIQDVTFVEKHNPVMLQFDCFDCDENNRVQLNYNMVKPKEVDQELVTKYFNEEKRSLLLQTKNLGEILYRPSTLGTAEAVYNFLKTKKPAYVKKNRQIIILLPRLMPTFRNVRNRDIEDMIEDWHSWSDTKISFIDKISKRLDFTIEDKAEIKCSNCKTENAVKVDPEGDVKYMFLRNDTVDEELI